MKKVFKIGFNAVLLAMFLGMLLLPFGFMGLMNFEEDSNVLSAQDSNFEESSIKSINNDEVPLDVKEMILKMEREYYQEQQDKFVEDIDRIEDKETLNPEDTENTDTEEIEEENIQIQENN